MCDGDRSHGACPPPKFKQEPPHPKSPWALGGKLSRREDPFWAPGSEFAAATTWGPFLPHPRDLGVHPL